MPLGEVFRAKLLAALNAAGISLPKNIPAQWVVDCKGVGAGEKALVYLGRYLYRGVIREQDILACQDGQVTFRYQNSKTRRMETRTLPEAAFLWLLLQHVLPKGLQRARNFGFLHPNSKRLIALLRVVFRMTSTKPPEAMRPAFVYPCCGGAMKDRTYPNSCAPCMPHPCFGCRPRSCRVSSALLSAVGDLAPVS